MSKKLTEKGFVEQLTDNYSVILNAGSAIRQMKISKFREQLDKDDKQVLQDLAFYIDINTASSYSTNQSLRVDVGGNLHMQAIWAASRELILMDDKGNYCRLNQNDARYTEDGEAIVDLETGAILEKWNHCDIMEIIPEYYGRIQTITVSGTTLLRPWFSLVPLPGGYTIPRQVVGKFKCSSVSSKLRSLPNYTPHNNITIRAFWDLAQARSKNHGLANADFRDWLLFYAMSTYGWRSSQQAQASDGTTVWGVGLDGTENTTGASGDGNARQGSIVTGATLSLGIKDGKVAVLDSAGGTCHKVNVAGFEDPWGQKWEMVQGLCSVGTDVYRWRSNFVPPTSSNPTADTFANIEHVVLQRSTTSNVYSKMNTIESGVGQGMYMVPSGSQNNTDYGDYYNYAASGQLWRFGGGAADGARCGLASSRSDHAWSTANSAVSARLAYYGDINKVSPSRLAELKNAA